MMRVALYARYSSDNQREASIIEDDDVPVATVSGPSSVGEGAAAEYTVSLDRSPAVGVEVDWAVSGTGDDAADADDFGGTLPSGTVSFAAGVTSGTFEVRTFDDATDEPAETFMVELRNPSTGLVLGTPASVETSITDGDTPVLSFVGAATRSVVEGAGPLGLDVTLDRSPAQDVTVTVRTSDGTATRPGDYGLEGDADDDGAVVLTFAAGVSGNALTQTASVAVVADEVDEADERFTVTLETPTGGAAIGDPASVEVTIEDDDVPVATVCRSIHSPDPAGNDGRVAKEKIALLLLGYRFLEIEALHFH